MYLLALIAGVPALPTSASAQAEQCEYRRTGISEPVFRRLLNQQFATLLSPQSNNILGNFAALDLKDAEVTFAGATVFRGGPVLGIKAHGGSAEGILPIITDQEVNTRVGAEIQLNLLHRKHETLQYDELSREAVCAAEEKLTRDTLLKSVEISQRADSVNRLVEIATLEKKLIDLRKAIDTTASPRKDSLRVELVKADTLLAATRRRALPDTSILRERLAESTAADLRKLPDSLKVLGFSIGWLSMSYAFENTEFRLFDPAATFDDQVAKHAFGRHEARVQYSRYRLSAAPYESYFWSFGTAFTFDHNLDELKKVDLTEKTQYGPSPDQRVSEKKYTAYQGDYRKNLATLRFQGDAYWFLFTNNQAALHLYPSIETRKGAAPTYGSGVGLLFSARGKEKGTTVNAELYYNLTDLTDTKDSDLSALGRSGFGARFTFPITFSPRS